MYSKEMEEKKNDLVTRAEGILNKAKEEKRELTDAEAQELAEIRDDVKKIKEALGLDDFFSKEGQKPKDEPKPIDAKEDKPMTEEEKKQTSENEERAFEAYIRGIALNERASELTKSANGAVIPTTIADKIIKKVYDICPILERADNYGRVKGKLDLPYYDTDTSSINVAYQDEFKALNSSNGSFKSIELTGFLAGALSKISKSLINNAKFDIVDFVVNDMAEAMKRFIEGQLLNGTEGKVTGLSDLTNKVTTAKADAVTSDELIDLQDSVKDVYQQNAIWIMSSKTRTAIRKLKGSDGRYLLQDDITAPFGKVLLGKPVYVSDNMPDLGAGKTAIYYGDLKGLAVKFGEDINVQVLREKYADEHADGVIGWFEFDSKVEDAQKLARLVCAEA